MSENSYRTLRRRLASVLDRVCDDQDVVIVRGRSNAGSDVAILPAEELARLIKTARLRYSGISSDQAVKAKRTSLTLQAIRSKAD